MRATAFALVLATASCGFQLRGTASLPFETIYVPGATGSDVPQALEDYGKAVVSWQGERIIEAIDGAVNEWDSPDGGRRPERVIKRIPCQTR